MSSMKASDVVGHVREMLNDEDPEYFWSEPWLRARLNEGIYELRERRGEAKLSDSTGDGVDYSSAGSHNATLCVSDHWKNHLTAYVLWKAYSRDKKDVGHARKAEDWQKEWERLLISI